MRFVLFTVLTLAAIVIAACAGQGTSPSKTVRTPAKTPRIQESPAFIEEATEVATTTQLSPTRPSNTIVTLTTTMSNPATPAQLEPTATATPTIATPPTQTPSPTPIPTSSVVENWLAYKNDYFGYEFAYPPEARISTQGVTGFPSDELPENMTAEEYLQQLEETYPDNLCVSVRYEAGFVTFVPAGEKERGYTGPCGVTGVGDYVITDLIETVVIDGVPVTGSGLRMRGTAGAWHGEFIMMDVSDTITTHYGGYEGYGGAGARRFTEEDFLESKETLIKIVTSFRQEEKSR